MKIISRNVNWIRAVARKWFFDFIRKYDPDFLCIQETKAFENQFLTELVWVPWYEYIWHTWEKPWYAWTAIFYKENLNIINKSNSFGVFEKFHEHGRITEIETEQFILINWYFPNWWTKADWTEMLTYKLDFYDNLIAYLKSKDSWKKIIITWDFNICHEEIDIARPKENQNSIWFLPIEREKFSELLRNWFIDVRRNFNPDLKDVYSRWSYRAWARPRNVWRRIDYFLVNDIFLDSVKKMTYLNEVMWSDHCPLELELKL